MMNIFGRRSDLPCSRKPAIERRTEAWFRRILFAAEHSWTTLCMSRKYLLAVICRSRGGLLADEKEEEIASNENNYY